MLLSLTKRNCAFEMPNPGKWLNVLAKKTKKLKTKVMLNNVVSRDYVDNWYI